MQRFREDGLSDVQKARLIILTLVFGATIFLGTLPSMWQMRLFVWITGLALASILVTHWRQKFLDKLERVRRGSIQEELNAEREAPPINYWLPAFIHHATRALEGTRDALQREIVK